MESGFSNEIDTSGTTVWWELDELVRESLKDKSTAESSRKGSPSGLVKYEEMGFCMWNSNKEGTFYVPKKSHDEKH